MAAREEEARLCRGGGHRWAHKVGTQSSAQGGAQGTPPGWAHKGAHKGAHKELPPGGRTRRHEGQTSGHKGFGDTAKTVGSPWAHKAGSRSGRTGWAHKAPALCTHRAANARAHKVGTAVGAQGRTRGAQGLE